jgi:hypothetical protein
METGDATGSQDGRQAGRQRSQAPLPDVTQGMVLPL